MSNYWAALKSWIDAPFTTPLDTGQIFLVTGIVVISAIAWHRIYADVIREV